MDVQVTWVIALISGQRVVRATDSSFDRGTLNYTLASVTNLDHGTRCSITDVDFWELGA